MNENIFWTFLPSRADHKAQGYSLTNVEYGAMLKRAYPFGFTPPNAGTGLDKGGAKRFAAALRTAAAQLDADELGRVERFASWLEGEGRYGYTLSRGWGNLLGNHGAVPSRVIQPDRPPTRFFTGVKGDALGKKAVDASPAQPTVPADRPKPKAR